VEVCATAASEAGEASYREGQTQGGRGVGGSAARRIPSAMGDSRRGQGEAQGGRGKAQGSSTTAAESATGTGSTATTRQGVAGRAGQGRQQNSFRQQDRANIQAEGLARHKEIEAQAQERNSQIEVERLGARQQPEEQEAQQDLARQRRQDRSKA